MERVRRGTAESPVYTLSARGSQRINAPKVAYGNYLRGIILGCIYGMKHKPPQHSTDNQRRLAKFNGCDSDKLVIHLMECEWRYNHREDDLYKELAKILKRY